MRVLGIDPGLTRCGIALVEGPPAEPQLAHARAVSTRGPLPDRLADLHATVQRLIEEHRPDVVACERVLFSRNARTAMATGQAAGVVLLAAAQAGVAVATYSPTEVKRAVAGDGRADKQAVARMVAVHCRLRRPPRPADAADAAAVALTHLLRARSAAGADASWEAVASRLRVVGGTGPAPPQPTPHGEPDR